MRARHPVALDPDTQRRIDKANREKSIFKTSPPDYHVPRTLTERALVRLGEATFWTAIAVFGVGTSLITYWYVLHPFVGHVVRFLEPTTRFSWAVVLLLAVPLYAFCWFVVVAALYSLELFFKRRRPEAYERVRMILWGIIVSAATIAFLLSWWNSVKTLPR